VLQCVAHTLPHTATHLHQTLPKYTAIHCNTLQRTATHLQHTRNRPCRNVRCTVCCSVLLCVAHTFSRTTTHLHQTLLKCAATHCNILQRTATHLQQALPKRCPLRPPYFSYKRLPPPPPYLHTRHLSSPFPSTVSLDFHVQNNR